VIGMLASMNQCVRCISDVYSNHVGTLRLAVRSEMSDPKSTAYVQHKAMPRGTVSPD